MILAKRQGLIDKEKMFKKKYKKYNKILNRLMWPNACSSGISVATGIFSVANNHCEIVLGFHQCFLINFYINL